jgi:hypothetical protein
MTTTRCLTRILSAGLLMLLMATCPMPEVASAAAAEGSAKPATLDQLRDVRKKAAQRHRRIIFNNDGNDAVYDCKAATPEALLACRTTALLGKQVDTISYCTWSSGFGYFTHRTKLGDVFTTTDVAGDPDKIGFSNNKTAEFLKQGTDPLAIMVEFAKKHNIEIWWSMRMNDIHDRENVWYGPPLFPPLKKKHPEWLIQAGGRRWTAVDYAHPEVRDAALGFIREVCENYDVDGVDLDFQRHLLYFACNAEGKDAGPAERDRMTDLIRRVRAMTDEVGLRRGRPILVSVRVPDSVGLCEAKGFDITRWLGEGLIDFMAVSDYVRLNPWKTSADLGHKYGVPVYACLSETRMQEPGPRASVECYRARAVEAWASGVDGIYVFNAFNPNNPMWNELGDPQKLETLDKVFTTGARGLSKGYLDQWITDGARFLNRDPVSPERPRKLAPGQAVTIDLMVGQEVRRRDDLGLKPGVELQLLTSGVAKTADLAVKLNGQPLVGGASKSDGWMSWAVDPGLLRRPDNRFEITLVPESTPQPAMLKDLLLWVRYKK